MRKKIIFLDVDGTLTDYEKHIPAFAAEAIRKARANGHRVFCAPAAAEQNYMMRSERSAWMA